MYINQRRGLETVPWGLPIFVGERDREPSGESKKEASEVEEIKKGSVLGSDEASFLRKRE